MEHWVKYAGIHHQCATRLKMLLGISSDAPRGGGGAGGTRAGGTAWARRTLSPDRSGVAGSAASRSPGPDKVAAALADQRRSANRSRGRTPSPPARSGAGSSTSAAGTPHDEDAALAAAIEASKEDARRSTASAKDRVNQEEVDIKAAIEKSLAPTLPRRYY